MGGSVNAQLLSVLTGSRKLGFLGPGSIEDHIEHALGFATAYKHLGLGTPKRAVDLGSGGGIPGLALVDQWPDTQIDLLDGSTRRCAFLMEAVEILGVANRCHVLEGRAEDLGRREDLRGTFDLVVARSFGPPAVLAECAAGFLTPDGVLVVSEPPEGSVAERWPEGPLAQLGYGSAVGVLESSHYAVLQRIEACPERYPRRVGVPTKRPLF